MHICVRKPTQALVTDLPVHAVIPLHVHLIIGFDVQNSVPSVSSTRTNASSQELVTSSAAGFPLEGLSVLDAQGNEVKLPAWGEDDTVVFALLRHFG